MPPRSRFAVVTPPDDHRHHSGISRPKKQLALESRQNHVLGFGGVLGPLVDVLLLASAHVFVGTVGSSFSEQALAWGSFRHNDPKEPERRALLFVTPYAKSFAGAKKAGGVDGADVPTSTAEARVACRAP